jgi:hypothetical protein
MYFEQISKKNIYLFETNHIFKCPYSKNNTSVAHNFLHKTCRSIQPSLEYLV